MSSLITVEELSIDQRMAYDQIMRWTETRWTSDSTSGSTVLTLGGYAGTGKSTLISLIAERIGLPAFCAFTGKATSVLRRKLRAAGIGTIGAQPRKNGIPSNDSHPFCGTIHSLIYRPCDCREPKGVEIQKPCPEKDCTGETRWEDDKSLCGSGHAGLIDTKKAFERLKPKTKLVYAMRGPDGVCTICKGKEWIRRELLDRDYDLIIVDEASMVDDTMLRDLREYGVPILAVGDHGQLPPVGGSGSLMKAPNLRLERIHRQAEGNPIIALSKIIRETGRLPDKPPGDTVRYERLKFADRFIEERYADSTPARLLEMGLVCYMNRTRLKLNTSARRALGFARVGRELPQKGEHVVCLRNIQARDGLPPIANGMRGVLHTDAAPKQFKRRNNNGDEIVEESPTQLIGSIGFPEDEIEARPYEMLAQQFGREKTYAQPEELQHETGLHSFAMAGALFDYGYAMTVHKMQGSSVKDLVGVVERPAPASDDDFKRWLYTLVTRASERLTLLR